MGLLDHESSLSQLIGDVVVDLIRESLHEGGYRLLHLGPMPPVFRGTALAHWLSVTFALFSREESLFSALFDFLGALEETARNSTRVIIYCLLLLEGLESVES